MRTVSKTELPSLIPSDLPPYFYALSLTIRWQEGAHKRDRITGKETRNKWSSTKSQNFVDYSPNCPQFCEFDLNQMFLLHKTEKLVCEHWIKIHVCHVFPFFVLIKQESYCLTWDSHSIQSRYNLVIAPQVTQSNEQIWTFTDSTNKLTNIHKHSCNFRWVRYA